MTALESLEGRVRNVDLIVDAALAGIAQEVALKTFSWCVPTASGRWRWWRQTRSSPHRSSRWCASTRPCQSGTRPWWVVLFHGSSKGDEAGDGKNERRIVWESADIVKALDE